MVPESALQVSKEQNNQWSFIAMMPMNHNDDEHGTIILRVPSWYVYLGSSQVL